MKSRFIKLPTPRPLADLQRRIDNTTDAIGASSNDRVRDRLTAKLDKLVDDEEQAASELEKQQVEYDKLTRAATDLTQWRADFAGLMKALDSPDIRGLAKPHLRKLIEKIEVFAVGLPEDQPDMKDALLDALDYFVPPQSPSTAKLKGFEQWLLKSCTTKAGRFIRVTFVTGQVVDLVPNGSVATGHRLVGEQRHWYHSSPDIKELWRRYIKGYKA